MTPIVLALALLCGCTMAPRGQPAQAAARPPLPVWDESQQGRYSQQPIQQNWAPDQAGPDEVPCTQISTSDAIPGRYPKKGPVGMCNLDKFSWGAELRAERARRAQLAQAELAQPADTQPQGEQPGYANNYGGGYQNASLGRPFASQPQADAPPPIQVGSGSGAAQAPRDDGRHYTGHEVNNSQELVDLGPEPIKLADLPFNAGRVLKEGEMYPCNLATKDYVPGRTIGCPYRRQLALDAAKRTESATLVKCCGSERPAEPRAARVPQQQTMRPRCDDCGNQSNHADPGGAAVSGTGNFVIMAPVTDGQWKTLLELRQQNPDANIVSKPAVPPAAEAPPKPGS